MNVIFGLDPGASTGFAKVGFDGDKVQVFDYGIVPMPGDDVDSLVRGIGRWITDHCLLARLEFELVFSAIPYLPGRRTHYPSLEVQGVIRAAGGIGYNPSTIHSQLGTRNKADTKAFVARVLGFRPTSIDHVTDAFAVCFCHALKMGLWQPHITAGPMDTPGTRQTRHRRHQSAKEPVSVGATPTQDELREMLARGKAKVGRR